ncbi:MAG: pilus assembly protein PilP [Smithella sp.]|jgi:type IV pilus assembly protein PilP
MKKIKFAIASTFIIVFAIEIFSFAAEVKNTLPATSTVSAAPAATSKQIQQSVAPAVPVAPAATPTQIQQPPPPAPASIDNYSYNPSGKPDPFKPFIVVDIIAVKKQVAKKAEASMFPLQRVETEKYRVVGIAGDKNYRVAIAEDEAKKFYPLFIGTHIGLYNGKVIEIMADRVIVEEYETKKAKRVILKLRKN